MVWLLDIRHEPSDEDQVVRSSVLTEHPVLAVLTKLDKRPRGQRAAAYASGRATWAFPNELLLTSATSR